MTKKSKKRIECFFCEKLFLRRQLTRDHLIPQALGGTFEDNIVLACAFCNVEKANRLPTEDEIQKFIRKTGHYPGGENGKYIVERYRTEDGKRKMLYRNQSERFRMKVENQIISAIHRVHRSIELSADRHIRELGCSKNLPK